MTTPHADLSPAGRILVTAHTLFYRDGIRATGIDRVIAESGVAKKTFYRYYPAKSDLIVAFLEYRHRNWMTWFEDAVQRHGADADALVPALAEWFERPATSTPTMNPMWRISRPTDRIGRSRHNILQLLHSFLDAER